MTVVRRRLARVVASPWELLLPAVFIVVTGWWSVGALLDARSLGANAALYTDAARAWVGGGDPWAVGPPADRFAGPPTMLLPFAPFVLLPNDIVRVLWVVGSAALAILTIRRLGLPGWWIAFPPVAMAIELGHPEVLVLSLLVLPGALSGLAPLVKTYAVLPLLGEGRWRAIVLLAVGLVVTLPILPWRPFLDRFPEIQQTLAVQSHGDSVWGEPLLMAIAAAALLSLGSRRALWLAVPLLWPSAQPTYMALSLPALCPLVALFWAIPVPGTTLAGIVVLAVCERVARRRRLPGWLRQGIAAASPRERQPEAAPPRAGPVPAAVRP